jgi:hypothetical protein
MAGVSGLSFAEVTTPHASLTHTHTHPSPLPTTRLCADSLGPQAPDYIDALVNIFQSLVQIGAGLSHNREWRDIFEDLLDRVALPLQEIAMTPNEFDKLLRHVERNAQTLALSEEGWAAFRRSFRRFSEHGLVAANILLSSTAASPS